VGEIPQALHPGVDVGQDLIQQIYDLTDDHESNTLDVFIYKIRKKLAGHRRLLKTVPGRGYVLSETLEAEQQADAD